MLLPIDAPSHRLPQPFLLLHGTNIGGMCLLTFTLDHEKLADQGSLIEL